jgi:transcriptional regulator with GAF, ATPase, and Fis domain
MTVHYRRRTSVAVRSLLLKARYIPVAGSEALLRGENPAGKNVLAGHIQLDTRHRKNVLSEINCAFVSHETAESQLFGHEFG